MVERGNFMVHIGEIVTILKWAINDKWLNGYYMHDIPNYDGYCALSFQRLYHPKEYDNFEFELDGHTYYISEISMNADCDAKKHFQIQFVAKGLYLTDNINSKKDMNNATPDIESVDFVAYGNTYSEFLVSLRNVLNKNGSWIDEDDYDELICLINGDEDDIAEVEELKELALKFVSIYDENSYYVGKNTDTFSESEVQNFTSREEFFYPHGIDYDLIIPIGKDTMFLFAVYDNEVEDDDYEYKVRFAIQTLDREIKDERTVINCTEYTRYLEEFFEIIHTVFPNLDNYDINRVKEYLS